MMKMSVSWSSAKWMEFLDVLDMKSASKIKMMSKWSSSKLRGYWIKYWAHWLSKTTKWSTSEWKAFWIDWESRLIKAGIYMTWDV